jgi:competence protein ComEC
MASYKSRKRRFKKKYRTAKRVITISVVIIAAILAIIFGRDFLAGEQKPHTSQPVSGGEVQFHFIDVGQADAALIRTAEGNILIDAGMGESEDALKAYLDNLGITEIEYAVFTHPHEDHIGGADMIVLNYNVKNVILPDKTHNTKTFERMMDAIEERGCKVIKSVPEKTFTVGELTCTILAPIEKEYDELNDYSVVVRADYGDTSVLFTGDAEVLSENQMIDRYGSAKNGILDCDILKVGHHGSTTSSGQKFLDAVTPDHGVISVGEGNTHGHPVPSILERYEKSGITVYRTDKEGSIVFKSTGGEPVKQ